MRRTVRDEAFAVAVASGASLSDAYRQCHPNAKGNDSTIRKDASVMSRRPAVKERIAELRDMYAKAAMEASRGVIDTTKAPRAYSVADAMAELDKVSEQAEAARQVGTMAKVVELRMKLYGLGIGDAKNPADKEEMGPEELEEALRDVRAARAAAQVVPLKAVK